MTIRLHIRGVPVPLQRSRTRDGRHYLPKRSRDYRMLVQAEWMAAGRPSLGASPFTAHMWFSRRRTCDLDNLVKAILDSLNGLAFEDDRQASEVSARWEPALEPCALVELEAA